jgi:uncharacterized protein involved in exopolysaccharide biosynthesis
VLNEAHRLNAGVLDRPQPADPQSAAARLVAAAQRGPLDHRETLESRPEVWSDDPAPAVDAGAILRSAVLLILLAAVGAAGAFAAATYADKVYAARSEIAFDLRGLSWDSAERFLATQAVIATSQRVLEPIAAALGLQVKEIEEHLEVEKIGSSGVVRLQYADKSGPLALDVARAVTDRYLAELSVFGGRESTGQWVLSPAFLLDEPIAPQPLRAAALGALAGLVVGIAGLLLRALARPAR